MVRRRRHQGTLRIWSLEDRQELVTKQLYRNGLQHIAISPDASEIATITYDSDVTIWTADKLEQKQKFDVTASGVERIEYASPHLLAAAGESTTMWDTSTGAKAYDLPAGRYNFALGPHARRNEVHLRRRGGTPHLGRRRGQARRHRHPRRRRQRVALGLARR